VSDIKLSSRTYLNCLLLFKLAFTHTYLISVSDIRIPWCIKNVIQWCKLRSFIRGKGEESSGGWRWLGQHPSRLESNDVCSKNACWHVATPFASQPWSQQNEWESMKMPLFSHHLMKSWQTLWRRRKQLRGRLASPACMFSQSSLASMTRSLVLSYSSHTHPRDNI